MGGKMKVFISWSGERSKYIAENLRNWIPKVIQAVYPWMSEGDIASGARWSAEIAKELEETKVGIICITPENQDGKWLMFEAGALSKTFSYTYVCPYLYELAPAQLTGPLAQFQAVRSDKDGTFKLVQTLNKALPDQTLNASELEEVFEVWWPKFESRLISVPEFKVPDVKKRSPEEILVEVLDNTREQLRRENLRLEYQKQIDSGMNDVLKRLQNFADIFRKRFSIPKLDVEVPSTDQKELMPSTLDLEDMFNEDMLNAVAKLKGIAEVRKEFDKKIIDKELSQGKKTKKKKP